MNCDVIKSMTSYSWIGIIVQYFVVGTLGLYNISKQWFALFCFRTRNRGQSYVNCLTAAAETWSGLSSTGAMTSDRSLRLPWTWMSLGSSGKSRSHQKRLDFRHKTFALKQLVAVIEKQSQQIHSGKWVVYFDQQLPNAGWNIQQKGHPQITSHNQDWTQYWVFNPEERPITELFLNNDTRSSYSPKFDG